MERENPQRVYRLTHSGPSSAQLENPIYTVTQLAGKIRACLEGQFAAVRVAGELTGISVASSGHVYFSLKDAGATLSAVMFRNAAARVDGSWLKEGMEVECAGRLTLYEPRGRMQLIVEVLLPRGAGALGLQFLALKAKLQAEGLFDPARKRPLPAWPKTIGIVTSPSGAAVQDILKILGLRMPSIPVVIYPVRVQGEGSAAEIAQGVTLLGDGQHCDVLIVGRGGGSAEDLSAFNEEVVVRAVVGSRVPVVSAVGHEVDLVLCDLAADARAPTPTAAAEMVVPDRRVCRKIIQQRAEVLSRVMMLGLARAREQFARVTRRMRDPRLVLSAHRLHLDDSTRSMQSEIQRRMQRSRNRLNELRVRLAARDPKVRLKGVGSRLAQARLRLMQVMQKLLLERRTALGGHSRALSSLNPFAVLGRGYGIIAREDGVIVRSATQVELDQTLRIRLFAGALESRVTKVEGTPGGQGKGLGQEDL